MKKFVFMASKSPYYACLQRMLYCISLGFFGLGLLNCLSTSSLYRSNSLIDQEASLSQEDQQFPEIEPPLPVFEQKRKLIKRENISSKQGRKELIDRRPDHKGRRLISRLQAGQMIRETFVVNGKTQQRISLTGGAVIYHGPTRIRASRIVIKNGDYGTFQGGVEIYDAVSKITLYAKKAYYDRNRQLVRLQGKPYFKKNYGKLGKVLLVSCQSIDHFLQEKRSQFKEKLHVSFADMDAFADEASYLEVEQTLTLKKNPVIIGKGSYFTGEELVYQAQVNKQFFELKKHAIAYLYEKYNRRIGHISRTSSNERMRANENQKKNSLKIKTSQAKQVIQSNQQTVLTADRLRYFTAKHVIHANGNVFLSKDEMRLSTGDLRLFGTNLQDVSAQDGVQMIDRKRKLKIKAKKMDYDDQKQKLLLQDEAYISFYSLSEQEVPTSLSASWIERDLQKKQTTAQGQVIFSQKQYRAQGEIANYDEDAQVIIMKGSPGVYNKGLFMEAEKIFIYPEKERILFHNQVRSSIQSVP